MRIATIGFVAATALNVGMAAAWAEQNLSGTITKIDRLNGTIGIQQTQNGTVGASSGSAAEQYKIQDRGQLENVHAGDKVKFTTDQAGGAKTITKLQKQ
jgi:Cu/Ag efflux protein CusF